MQIIDILIVLAIVLSGSILCMIFIFLGITCINYLLKEKSLLEENLNDSAIG